MTLTESIQTNPYLKISNCADISDCEFGMAECNRLEKEFGHFKTLDSIWNKLFEKRNKLKSA